MPGLKRTTTCRGCGKQIAFIKTISGKSIPVDPERIAFIPETDYEKFVTEDGLVKRGGKASEGSKHYMPFEYGYRSHFATCPAADSFRKKNKSERTKKGGAGREEGAEYPGNYHGQQEDRTGD